MFKLQIITPEKIVADEEIDEVLVPTKSGELGILPHHAPLVSEIEPGELTIKIKGKERNMAVAGGFVEVNNNVLTVLADYVMPAENINEKKAQEAKDRAEKLMKEKITNVDLAEIEKEFARALADLRVARKYRAS